MQGADQDIDRVVQLRHAVQRSRAEMLAARQQLVEARQELIESFGDWMCGQGTIPHHAQIEALSSLAQRSEEADLLYARAITALVAEIGGCSQPRC